MDLELIKNLCKQTPTKLQASLYKFLKCNSHYKFVKYANEYIIAEGELPICLVAHMDTVFSGVPSEFFYDRHKKMLWSPYGSGFDDRAGIYLILKIIEKGFYPSIIFTQGEEMGGIGAHALIKDAPECPLLDCRALIQLDRAHKEDAVFYECDNKDFEKFICSYGFKYDWGTFTDISIIAPAWKIAAVNLSVGYVDEHTTSERLYCKWTDLTFKRLCKILEDSKDMKSYSYIPHVYNSMKDFNNYYSMFKDNDIYDFKCLICDKEFDVGRHVYYEGGSGYDTCEECFKKYHVDNTPNKVIKKT